MTSQHSNTAQAPIAKAAAKTNIVRFPSIARWHDPLQLMQDQAPSQQSRLVLRSVIGLVLLLMLWAGFGQLDIIAVAEGKLVPQSLLKIVQPAEAGVVKQLLVKEGEHVKAGQVLVRLDPTIANAEQSGMIVEWQRNKMQERRIEAELADLPLQAKPGEDKTLFAQVEQQFFAHRNVYRDSLAQEQALLQKAQYERKSALAMESKLQQTLPSYQKTADAYSKLEKEGFYGNLASNDKQREALEKRKELEAQNASVAALDATIAAQEKKIAQIRSNYQAQLQNELTEVRSKISQLQPNMEKGQYRVGLMELRAPQDGTIKDIATTTQGAVVQPGSVLMTLVPSDELLFADVVIKNEDVGFVQTGQKVQIKLATYPFQRYGMVHGTLEQLGADASEVGKSNNGEGSSNTNAASYKARIRLERQVLVDAQGQHLQLAPGMQLVAEVNQGKRSVLAYLLSPVQKAVSEAGRER